LLATDQALLQSVFAIHEILALKWVRSESSLPCHREASVPAPTLSGRMPMATLDQGARAMTKLEGIAQAADGLSDEIVALRRKIHEHPELAFEEQQTATRVEEFLNRLAIPCRTGIRKTGVVALLQGGAPGPTIAIRADMDALPIDEPAGLP